MAVKKKYILIILIALVSFPLCPSHGEDMVPKDKLIQIVSDRLDVYDGKQVAVFSGSVQVNQQDTIINSDELHVFYKKEGGEKKSSDSIGAMNAGDIERIEARGKVRITQGERIVTGDNAVLFYEEQKILVTGDTMMQEGKNRIKGGRITFFMNEKRGIVERAERERVTATIYPKEEE